MRKLLMESRCRRLNSGAALVEGVVALALITIGTVAAVTLLVNAGMSTYYKEKLGFVTNQCAAYAGSLSPSDDMEGKTELMAKALLKAMGMPYQNSKTKVEMIQLEDRGALKVTISVNGFGLFGSGDILPTTISLQDSSTSLRSGMPSGYLWMNNNARFSGYLIPALRVPPGGPQSLGMPLYIP